MSLTLNVAYSASHYLNRFYSSNRSAAKTESYRSNCSNHTLVLADSEALKKAAETLSDMDYDATDELTGSNIYNSVNAFVTAYNNFMDSSATSDYHYIQKQKNDIKELVQEHTQDFEKIGITINTKGKLEIDKDELENTNLRKLKKIFSSKNDFCDSLKKYATAALKYEKNHVPQKSVSTGSNTSSGNTVISDANALTASSMADLTGSVIGSNVDLAL